MLSYPLLYMFLASFPEAFGLRARLPFDVFFLS